MHGPLAFLLRLPGHEPRSCVSGLILRLDVGEIKDNHFRGRMLQALIGFCDQLSVKQPSYVLGCAPDNSAD